MLPSSNIEQLTSGQLAANWLLSHYPRGVTRKDIERHHGDDAEGVIALGLKSGAWKWITRPDRRRCPGYFVRPDWEQPPWDLTKRQRNALAWMLGQADENLRVRASYRDINRATGGSMKGCIIYFVDQLARRGYLVIVERGRGKRATLFQLYPNGNSPQRHMASERLVR